MKRIFRKRRYLSALLAAVFCAAAFFSYPVGAVSYEEEEGLLIEPEWDSSGADAAYDAAAEIPAEESAGQTQENAAAAEESAGQIQENAAAAEESAGQTQENAAAAEESAGQTQENAAAVEEETQELSADSSAGPGADAAQTAKGAENAVGNVPSDALLEIVGIEEVAEGLVGDTVREDDAESGSLEEAEYEAGENPFPGASELQLDPDRRIQGNVSAASPANYYKFGLEQSGKAELSGRSADIAKMRYTVLDAQGTSLWSADTGMNTSTGLNSCGASLMLNAGTYYLSVEQLNGSAGSYEFQLWNDPTGESFPESAGGSDNSMEAAHPITSGETYIGQISLNDNSDFYKFTLSASSRVDFASEQSATFDYRLLNASGKEYYSNGSDWLNLNPTGILHLTKGTYYFQVARKGDSGRTGSYRMTLTMNEEADSFQEPDGGSNNTIPTASKISLGKTYDVHLAMNDWTDFFQFTVKETQKITVKCSSDKPVCTLYDGNGNQIVDNRGFLTNYTTIERELQAGTYYVSVRSVHDPASFYTAMEFGSFQFSVSGYQPASAQLTKLENASVGVRLTWTEVPNATGYKIYRKNPGGSYKLVKTVKSGKTVTWADKSAVNGKTYYYRMRTLEGSAYSVLSNLKGIVCLDRPKISSLKNSAGGVAVAKITKNRKATGYQIMYAGNSKYQNSKSKSLTSTSYKIKKLKKGSWCCVRVRSYWKKDGKKYFSAWSPTVKVKIRK